MKKKYIIIIIVLSFVGGAFFYKVWSYNVLTEKEKEIKNLTSECLQYIDSKEECTNSAITQVGEEIKVDNQKAN